jgi:hypothetical protein
MVLVEEFQLRGIQYRAAVCERIQLKLQVHQPELSFSKGETNERC